MPVIIRLVADALTHNPIIPDRWVRHYDPDGGGGRGTIKTTDDPAKALQFATLEAATECWRQQSRKRPLRLDGKPNRPLTAYTVEFMQAPQ